MHPCVQTFQTTRELRHRSHLITLLISQFLPNFISTNYYRLQDYYRALGPLWQRLRKKRYVTKKGMILFLLLFWAVWLWLFFSTLDDVWGKSYFVFYQLIHTGPSNKCCSFSSSFSGWKLIQTISLLILAFYERLSHFKWSGLGFFFSFFLQINGKTIRTSPGFFWNSYVILLPRDDRGR